MARKQIRLHDLATATDLADHFGVKPGAVSNWKTRHKNFPEPVVVVGRGSIPLYSLTEVLRWQEARERRTNAGNATEADPRLREAT